MSGARTPHAWAWGSTPHLPGSVRYVVTCSRCGRTVTAREYNRDHSTWLRECPALSDGERDWLLWCESLERRYAGEVQGELFG